MENYNELVGKSYYDCHGTKYTVISLDDEFKSLLFAADSQGNVKCQNADMVKKMMVEQGVVSGNKNPTIVELGSWDLIELTSGWRPELLKD